MDSLVKRYANALCEALDGEIFELLLKQEERVQECYKDCDFFEIIKNPFIDPFGKLSVLEAVLGLQNTQIHRALSVLAQHDRLILLPKILREMRKLSNLSKNFCNATLFVQESIDAKLLEDLQQALEKKIGCKVCFQEKKWDQEGIKCSVEDLDLEISLSRERLTKDFKEFVLDSITKGV